jgi:hypothetical protein
MERDKFMRLSTGMHTYMVKGDDTYKSEPDRAVMDVQATIARENAMITAKLTGTKNVLKPRVNTKTGLGCPLDYSYLDIKDLSELEEHEPAAGIPKPKPVVVDEEAEEPIPAPQPTKAPSNLRTTGLRVGYNQLTTVSEDAAEHINKVLDDPVENLLMLDMCCNRLSRIPAGLLAFQNLSVLYLHGNNITDIREVKKLAKLKKLSKLTLHGNAVFYEATDSEGRKAVRLEENDYYRPRIIYYLRETSLKSLDNIPITPKDRENALIWYQNHARKKR